MGIFAAIMLLLALLLMVGAAAGGVVSFKVAGNDSKKAGDIALSSIVVGVIGLIIGVIFFCGSVVTIVPTKNRGVVTTFGKVDYEVDNGFHLTYPWQNVTNMDGTVQLEQFNGATDDQHTGNAILVTLGNNTKAHANASIQYRLDPGSLGGLYQNFRDTKTIKDNLVNTNFDQALNTEMGKFDPLACKPSNPNDPASKCVVPDQANFGPMSDAVEKDMHEAMIKSHVGGKVIIDRVIITGVVYNSATQDQLNKLLEEKAKTRVAEQAELTADAQAAANNKLRDSLRDDPNVLVSKCLDLIRDGKLNSAVGCSPGSVGPGVPIIQVPGH